MTDPTDQLRKAAAWIAADHAPAAAAAAAHAGFRISAVGTDERGMASAVADTLGCSALVDIRASLVGADADLFLFQAAADFGAACDSGDARAAGDARARGLKIAAIEPTPASAQDLLSAGWARRQHGTAPIDGVRAAALITRSEAFAQAAEALDAFGPISALTVTATSRNAPDGPPDRSLGALLFDAVEAVCRLLGEPEQVTAGVRAHQPRWHTQPSLRIAGGEASAFLRTTDGRTAQITASDRAGITDTRLTLLGPGGRIDLFADGFTWTGASGDEIDRHRSPPPPGGLSSWQRRLARSLAAMAHDPAEGQLDWSAVLCTCDAILLGARTGATESPQTLRRAFGAGSFLFD